MSTSKSTTEIHGVSRQKLASFCRKTSQLSILDLDLVLDVGLDVDVESSNSGWQI